MTPDEAREKLAQENHERTTKDGDLNTQPGWGLYLISGDQHPLFVGGGMGVENECGGYCSGSRTNHTTENVSLVHFSCGE